MLIEHDAAAHAESLNGKYEKACAKLASQEHPFSKISMTLKARPSCSTRRSSLSSLKAKRGVDGCFGREGRQYIRDGHYAPDIMCADIRAT